ncbi:MAG: sigma-70 family RNA polymerase sigma factor [Oceanicaulis sp.]
MTQRELNKALDAYLVAAARTGDRKAERDLVVRFQPRLLGHAWRLTGDPVMAQDAVQEAWLRIAKGLSKLRDDAAFPAFAFQIVTRCCAQMIARARRDRDLSAAAAAEPEPEAPDSDRDADLAKVRAAMVALPGDQRAAIALYHFEGFSVAETAAALDVPAGTVKTRLMHARAKLRAMLTGDEDEQ